MKRPYALYIFPPYHGSAARWYRSRLRALLAWSWIAFLGHTARLYDIRTGQRIARSI